MSYSKKPTDLIGMSEKEVEGFSLLRACRQLAANGKLEGLEREASEAAKRTAGRMAKDNLAIFVPADVLHHCSFNNRANNATNFAAGGATVQTNVGSMIELLRNKQVLVTAGAKSLDGLRGDVALPIHTGGAVATWTTETGTIPDSESTFSQRIVTPHRLGATVPYSTQFLAQSGIAAENFIRADIMTCLAIEKDRAALHGLGAAGEPLGLSNTTGINSTVTFGGAAEWADCVEFETGVAADNADVGSMAYITTPAVRGKWKTKLRDPVAGGYLWEGSMVGQFPAYATNQVAGNVVFFGVWSQIMFANWSGLEVIVDPFTLKKSGQVEITVNELCDIVILQPLSFNVSTDSGAQ